MINLLLDNKKIKKAFCTLLAVCTVLCFNTAVYASGITLSPTPNNTSTGINAGGSAFVAAYNVVDGSGAEIVNLYPGTACTVAFIVVDTRFQDSEATPWMGYAARADLSANIHAKISSSNFSSVTGTDASVQKRENVDGSLSYAVIFRDTVYQGTDNGFSFDLSFTKNVNGLDQSMGVQSTTLSQPIAQCAKEGDGIKTAKPSVMVKDSNYGATAIDAGSTFALTLTSYNTSKTRGITDVKTTISLPTQLTLASGSNMVLTESVAAGASFANTFQLQAQSSAETGVVNITVDYSYYEKDSETALTSSQLITVAITQPDRFSVTSIDIPTDMYTTQEDIITVNFVNKGKSILYNLSTEISGDMDTMVAEDPYVGNVAAGTQSSADFTIMSAAAGTHTGVITITYEDINGKLKTQTVDYEVTVSDMPTYDGGGTVGPEVIPEETPAGFAMPWWGWAIIAVLLIAIIIVLRKIIKNRHAAKIARELEQGSGAEADEDEDF